jgi:hypothetical protein
VAATVGAFFAMFGCGADVDVAEGVFVAATVGAFFAMLGCGADVDALFVAAGALDVVVAVAVDAGDGDALLGDAAGAGAAPDVEDLLDGAKLAALSVGAGGLLVTGAGAGATAVSALAGFGCGGAGDFSAAGSDLFSLTGFEGASDMVIVVT